MDISKKETTTMNEIQIFNFENKKVRTLNKEGETWWVLKDVCDVLELTDTNKVAERLDEDELTRAKFVSGGQHREMYIINESGLYSAILRSDKPEAKRFRRWVTHEVLPAIRKKGYYDVNDHQPRQMFLNFTDSAKLIYANATAASFDCIPLGSLARILRGHGINIGRRRIFKRLRQDGFLINSPLAERNNPSQKALEINVLKLCPRAHVNADGLVRISLVTMVTGLGQIFFVNYFRESPETETYFEPQQLDFE